jgi:hypothetical protein
VRVPKPPEWPSSPPSSAKQIIHVGAVSPSATSRSTSSETVCARTDGGFGVDYHWQDDDVGSCFGVILGAVLWVQRHTR